MRTAMVQPMVTPMVRPMVNSEAANRYPYLFGFTAKLLALPEALQRLNATYTRNSAKTVVQDGQLVTLSANQFGTSCDPVTGLYGYVPEPAATNLVTHSQDFSQPQWTGEDVQTQTAQGTAPDGANTANRITDSVATTAVHFRGANYSFANATTYTWSVFLKGGTGSSYVMASLPSAAFTATGRRAVFNLAAGSVHAVEAGVTALIRSVGNGWYRCSITATSITAGAAAAAIALSPTGAYSESYLGAGANSVLAWGAQLETGSRATSYIATTGSTASRAADVLSVPLANIPGFTAAGYTLFADGRFDSPNTAAARRLVSVNDGTENNRALIQGHSSNTYGSTVTNGGVTQSDIAQTALTTSRFLFAYSAAENSFLRAVSGASGSNDLSGSMPVSPSMLHIGTAVNGTAQANGFIFRAGLIPQALTQEQINGLTTL